MLCKNRYKFKRFPSAHTDSNINKLKRKTKPLILNNAVETGLPGTSLPADIRYILFHGNVQISNGC